MPNSSVTLEELQILRNSFVLHQSDGYFQRYRRTFDPLFIARYYQSMSRFLLLGRRAAQVLKDIFWFARLTDDELRADLPELEDMLARHLLMGRR